MIHPAKSVSDPPVLTPEHARELVDEGARDARAYRDRTRKMEISTTIRDVYFVDREIYRQNVWSVFCNGWILIWWAAFVGRA